MGNYRPIKTAVWITFLKAHGCKYLRTTASHDHYKCPGCFRTITFRQKDKEIPAAHLRSNLRSMGYDLKYLYDWVDDYNKKKRK